MKNHYILAAGVLSLSSLNVSAEELHGLTAADITSMITTGWNLGNTLDANSISGLASETNWVPVKTTQEMIDTIRAAGFNAVRIPVSWGLHTTKTFFYDEEKDEDILTGFDIDKEWMARVHEIVDYCINDSMFVIINCHHDNSRDYYYPSALFQKKDSVWTSSIWSQIAEEFKDYDQHLIFETFNEPRLVGTNVEWWFDYKDPDDRVLESIEVLNYLNQVAVNTIRTKGENNADRVIMCPGYAASWEGCMTETFAMPQDSTPDRLVLSLHAYQPYDFCLNASGSGSYNAVKFRNDLSWYFGQVATKFIDNGIPVIIGEESASNKNNKYDRLQWANLYYGITSDFGMPCFLWDNYAYVNRDRGEAHGHLDRANLTWFDRDFIDVIMATVAGEEVDLTKYKEEDPEPETPDDAVHLNNALSFDISPNPASDNVAITCKYNIKSVNVFSMSANVVLSRSVNSNDVNVDISSLSEGVYLVLIETSEGMQISKLIKK